VIDVHHFICAAPAAQDLPDDQNVARTMLMVSSVRFQPCAIISSESASNAAKRF
jgi:hypothetical protein